MNFEDEPYSRLYNRRTDTNRRLRWEGRCVMHELHYELDRAGIFEFSGDVVESIELATGIPREVVEVGLKRLLDTKTLVIRGNRLVWPRWLEGQTAQRTDRVRKQEERQRRRDVAKAEADGYIRTNTDIVGPVVTEPDNLSAGVTPVSQIRTESPSESQPVTLICTDPSLAEADTNSDAHEPTDGDGVDEIPDEGRPLAERARQWFEDPMRAQLELGKPESWPEVRAAFDAFRAVWPSAGKLRAGPREPDPRAMKILERFAEGVTPDELVQAARGSALDPYIVARTDLQTPLTVWRDAGQIDKYVALLRTPSKPARNGRVPPERITDPSADLFAGANIIGGKAAGDFR